MGSLLRIFNYLRAANEGPGDERKAPVLREAVVVSFFEDGAILLNHDSGLVHRVNSIGSQILSGLMKRLPPGAIIRSLAESHHVPVERVAHDLQSFLKHLDHGKFLDYRDVA